MVTPKITYSFSQISAASSKIKAFYETNNKLPTYVTMNNHEVTMPQFLQLVSDDIYQFNSEGSSSITLRTVKAPSKPIESVKTGILTKTLYINLVNVTRSYIYSTCKAPNDVNISLGKIKFLNLVYIFSKIVNFQKTNNRLTMFRLNLGTLSLQPLLQAQTHNLW
jgi:Pseudomurein-binding repeat